MQDIEIEFEELQTAGALGEGQPIMCGRPSPPATSNDPIEANRHEVPRTTCEAYPVGQTLELTKGMTKCLSAIWEEGLMVSHPSLRSSLTLLLRCGTLAKRQPRRQRLTHCCSPFVGGGRLRQEHAHSHYCIPTGAFVPTKAAIQCLI